MGTYNNPYEVATALGARPRVNFLPRAGLHICLPS